MALLLYLQDCDQLNTLDQFLFDGLLLTDNKDKADFVLEASERYHLTCTIEAFASFLEWALVMDTFDTVFLADFSDNAVMLSGF